MALITRRRRTAHNLITNVLSVFSAGHFRYSIVDAFHLELDEAK
jgi:hypothetical protein